MKYVKERMGGNKVERQITKMGMDSRMLQPPVVPAAASAPLSLFVPQKPKNINAQLLHKLTNPPPYHGYLLPLLLFHLLFISLSPRIRLITEKKATFS